MATRLQQDNQVKDLPLNEVGWVGIDRDDKQLLETAAYLTSNSGISGLQVLNPNEIEKAKTVFYRDGFVVVQNALSETQLSALQAAVDREIHLLLANDKDRKGNRGSHRYSFGSASRTGHMVHCPEWAILLDLPTLTPIITAIFESDQYIARGGGGDFCLPGAVAYQPLHSDMSDRVQFKHEGKTHTYASFHDPRGRMNYRDLPCPYIACNFLVNDATPLNGPTRQIPGTQNSHAPIPDLENEPDWMKLSTVNPAPAGSVMIRDVRAWHGGTPNLSNEVRAIPNVEFYAPWFREPIGHCLPREQYETLSDHGKSVAQYIVADHGEVLETGYRTGLGGTPNAFD